ncbi:hypothetical protein ACWEK5_47745 [Rhodococcus koreensis]
MTADWIAIEQYIAAQLIGRPPVQMRADVPHTLDALIAREIAKETTGLTRIWRPAAWARSMLRSVRGNYSNPQDS